MINGLQVVSHMPLFKIKSPGNVNTFNAFFAEIATFNVVETSSVSESFIYWPEMDAISLNFQDAGYDSPLIIPQLGTLFYVFMGMIGLACFQVLLLFVAKAIPKTSCLNDKVKRYLYWNGSIRFFMEGYLDFALMALINVKHLDWESDFLAVQLCNYFSIFVTVLTCTLPVVMCFLYLKSMQKWEEDEYQEKYGAFLDGT